MTGTFHPDVDLREGGRRELLPSVVTRLVHSARIADPGFLSLLDRLADRDADDAHKIGAWLEEGRAALLTVLLGSPAHVFADLADAVLDDLDGDGWIADANERARIEEWILIGLAAVRRHPEGESRLWIQHDVDGSTTHAIEGVLSRLSSASDPHSTIYKQEATIAEYRDTLDSFEKVPIAAALAFFRMNKTPTGLLDCEPTSNRLAR